MPQPTNPSPAKPLIDAVVAIAKDIKKIIEDNLPPADKDVWSGATAQSDGIPSPSLRDPETHDYPADLVEEITAYVYAREPGMSYTAPARRILHAIEVHLARQATPSDSA